VNHGDEKSCFVCGRPKGRNAKRAWPIYQAALVKIGRADEVLTQ
jgi:hypothetical protein